MKFPKATLLIAALLIGPLSVALVPTASASEFVCDPLQTACVRYLDEQHGDGTCDSEDEFYWDTRGVWIDLRTPTGQWIILRTSNGCYNDPNHPHLSGSHIGATAGVAETTSFSAIGASAYWTGSDDSCTVTAGAAVIVNPLVRIVEAVPVECPEGVGTGPPVVYPGDLPDL